MASCAEVERVSGSVGSKPFTKRSSTCSPRASAPAAMLLACRHRLPSYSYQLLYTMSFITQTDFLFKKEERRGVSLSSPVLHQKPWGWGPPGIVRASSSPPVPPLPYRRHPDLRCGGACIQILEFPSVRAGLPSGIVCPACSPSKELEQTQEWLTMRVS